MVDVAKSLGQIFWIGLVAGTLDITENIVFNAFRGITPWRIVQFIASGLIDGRSFQLGWASVGLGVLIQMPQRQRLQGVKGSKFTNFARAA